MSELPIIIVGGSAATKASLEADLTKRGYDVGLVGREYPSLDAALTEAVELLLLALPCDGETGANLIRKVAATRGAPPLIVLGVDATVEGPAEAFSLGAQDYLESATDTPRLLEALGLALGSSRRDSQLRFLRNRAAGQADFGTIAGECPLMQKTMAVVRQITTRTARGGAPPILITGETGTGKGLLAQCIHYNSVRRNEALIDVNCAAIPPSLIESELFGHERGAFTDARTSRPGLFETADRGSLFLDEIAALTPDLQAKLLVATEEKRVRRIGARHSKQIDVQLIAATHRDLEEMIQTGEFREDFYHRLNVLAVHMPALRDRGEDKILLAQRFISSMCKEYGILTRTLSPGARAALRHYHFPGNVRELKNQIERIILLQDDDVIRPEHFQFANATHVEVRSNHKKLEISLPETSFSLEQLEVEVLKKALAQFDGNVSRTARYLQISRQTLIYRIKKHGLGTEPPS